MSKVSVLIKMHIIAFQKTVNSNSYFNCHQPDFWTKSNSQIKRSQINLSFRPILFIMTAPQMRETNSLKQQKLQEVFTWVHL